MTNYTATKDGNWSDSSVWSPSGVPGSGDTAEIEYTVTVDVNATVGQSLPSGSYSASLPWNNALLVLGKYLYIGGLNRWNNGNAALIIAPGVTLTVRGDMIVYQAPLTLNAGSVLQFDSTLSASPSTTYYMLDIQNTYNVWNTFLIMNGTAGNRAVVQTVTGCMPSIITSGYKSNPLAAPSTQPVQDGGIIQATYGKFLRIGDATHNCMQPWITGGNGASVGAQPTYQFYLRHVEFNTCGLLYFYTQLTNTSYFDMSYVTFKNSTSSINQSLSNLGSTTVTTGYLKFDHNVFDKIAVFSGLPTMSVTNCVFQDLWALNVGYYNGCLMQNNMIVNTTQSSISGMIGVQMTYDNNYYCFNVPAYYNPHFLNGGGAAATGITTISNSISEFNGPDPNGDWLNNCYGVSSGNRSVNKFIITGNIVLPNSVGSQSATIITDEASGSGLYDTQINHNTTLSDVTAEGTVALNEASTRTAGMTGAYSSIKSNIFWNYTSNLAVSAGAPHSYAAWDEGSGTNVNVDQVSAANLDYNVHYNMKVGTVNINGTGGGTATVLGYSNLTFSTSTLPGAHDRNLNPGFVDPSRNLAKWDSVVLGGPGTADHAVAQMMLMNDDTGFNTNATLANLMAYVRQGYCPTHPSMLRGGHDGTTIGAVQSNAPYICIVMA